MCNYIQDKNKCSILNKQCPYVYFCNKKKEWMGMNNMLMNCKIKVQAEIPDGYYRVCFEKRGNLYVDYNGHIEVIPNPFYNVPLFVNAVKMKNGKWRLKQYEG